MCEKGFWGLLTISSKDFCSSKPPPRPTSPLARILGLSRSFSELSMVLEGLSGTYIFLGYGGALEF